MNIVFSTCPECGQKAIHRVKNDCTLLDGNLVPSLDRWQCSDCKANFFDDAAMRQIEAARSAKPPSRRGRVRVHAMIGEK